MKIKVNNQTFDIEFKHSVVPIEFFKQVKDPTGIRHQVKVEGLADQTTCVIQRFDKEDQVTILEGEARRYKGDRPNRVIARTVAFNRAIAQLPEHTRSELLKSVPFRLS